MKREMGSRFPLYHRVHEVSIKGTYINAQKYFVQTKAVEHGRFLKNKVNGRPYFLDCMVSFLLAL